MISKCNKNSNEAVAIVTLIIETQLTNSLLCWDIS